MMQSRDRKCALPRGLVYTVAIAMALSACATQRYGRLTPVSPGERSSLTCEQVELEIEKAEFFLADVRRQRSRTTGAHVLGALGDFGIGNVMEGDAAEKSGAERLRQLREMERDKGCIAAAAETPVASHYPAAPVPATAAGADADAGSGTREQDCRRKRGTGQQSGPYSPWKDLPC